MKKTLIVIAAILGFAVVASAQPRAIGVRAGYGGEISYQHDLGGNFLEADLGFLGGSGFYVTGVYDFVFASADIFNFYAGPGAQVGFWNGDDESGINLGIVGQIGAEVEIPSVPLNISLDWRPGFSFIHGGFYGAGIGLGLRYRF